jgi:phosphate:Na+ symporter
VDIFIDILKIIGIVGLFIFGMKIMSEGIQRLAGKAMRDSVERMVASTTRGILTGFFTTSLIQSSSAATVMIVSFVNAGIFKLRQAIALIMGANIGTTITAWLFLVFGFTKIGVSGYLWPLLAVATPMLFIGNNRVKNIGTVIFGFCIMFLGLGQLKLFFQALDLDNNREFLTYLQDLGSNGFWSILLFIFIGTVFTVLVQSSTVAMGFTLAFCSSGLPLELGAALVLGENLGTTATANIAALVANVHGKRAARAHTFFNLISIVWFLLFYTPILVLVDKVISATQFGSPLYSENTYAVAAALAFIHTFINIVTTLLCAGFTSKIAFFITKITPSKTKKDEEFSLAYMQQGISSTSTLYLFEAKKQLAQNAVEIRIQLEILSELLLNPDPDTFDSLFSKLNSHLIHTRKVHVEISTFLQKIAQNDLSDTMSHKLKALHKVIFEMESVAGNLQAFAKVVKSKNDEKVWFDSSVRENLKKIVALMRKANEVAYTSLSKENFIDSSHKIKELEEETTRIYKDIKANYIPKMESGEVSIKSGLFFSELIYLSHQTATSLIQISKSSAVY